MSVVVGQEVNELWERELAMWDAKFTCLSVESFGKNTPEAPHLRACEKFFRYRTDAPTDGKSMGSMVSAKNATNNHEIIDAGIRKTAPGEWVGGGITN